MPENPLLPNAALQKLYSAMRLVRTLVHGRPAGLEAILASVAQQLEPGDAVFSFAHGNALAEVLRPAKRGEPGPTVLPSFSNPLSFTSGVATAFRLAENKRLTVVLLDIRKPAADWATTLEHAQREHLPLIILCPEMPAGTGSLTWSALTQVVKKLRFPVLTVDGADAVAMYRAMQESILRARHGDGPSLLWCLLPASGGAKHFPKAAPLIRLERYMAARGIALPQEKANRKVAAKSRRS